LILASHGEEFGIPVIEMPLLLDLPATLIRRLPESYRRADTLEIASQIAIVSTAEATQTLFLLDVDRFV
jgi:purine-binding chemotaxis protein CheW